MILILCDEEDSSALWAAEALKLRGLEPMLLTGSNLAAVKQWHHTIGAMGVYCEIYLNNGIRLRSHEIKAVINRLPYVPSAWIRSIGGNDREYAIQEMQAFYLSWLHSLPCPKLNAPTPQGLCGNWRHPSVWTTLAVQAGLPVKPYRQTSNDNPELFWQTSNQSLAVTVYVVGRHVIGPDNLLYSHTASCLHLAQIANVLMLGIDFTQESDGKWVMSKVSVMPDLICGGEKLINAIIGVIT